jgi:hypothetical protein
LCRTCDYAPVNVTARTQSVDDRPFEERCAKRSPTSDKQSKIVCGFRPEWPAN